MANFLQSPELLRGTLSRRGFLQRAALATAATAVVVVGCKKDEPVTPPAGPGTLSLGSGDVGVLNYAYLLEQLEAAFYIQVASNAAFTSIFTNEEQDRFKEIRDHEIIHRDFFKAAIPTANRIGDASVDFSAINFGDKTSILTYASTFEDLGVGAYNGAGKLLVDANYLLLAGKIVSVEARHAAYIRNLIMPNTRNFAPDALIDSNGFDRALTPSAVLAAADPFVKNTIDASQLPQ